MSTKNTAFVMRILSAFLIMVLSVGPMGTVPAHAAGILHVAPDGSGDCSDWANACSLQTALTNAVGGDEIWVQAGVYKPTTDTDRAATFQLKSGVAVYGGFAGTESTRGERDFTLNVTTLSGDLLGNDNDTILPDEPTRADNSYHVVTGASGAILDGFTVTAGNANDSTFPNGSGGGFLGYNSNSTLANILFLRNTTPWGGGGMFNLNSDSILTDVTFRENNAAAGGGIYSIYSNPMLTKVTFDNNSATNGGGMFVGEGNSTLTDVVFIGNVANMGGGLYNESDGLMMNNITFFNNSTVDYGNGGGMMQSMFGYASLTNATFTGNSAQNGGGYANASSDASTLTNITFTGNIAENNGGSVYNVGYVTIRNTILWGNTDLSGLQVYDTGIVTINDSVIQGECSIYSMCSNIITDDPLFGTLGDHGGYTQTIPIQAGSSAIDATSNNCPATDQRGLSRSNPACDIGAYELQISNVLHAAPGGLDSGACSSWAEACDLQYALTNAVSGQEIWVRTGTYKPTSGTDRAATFQLKSGVTVYGGFAGTESTREERNFTLNASTLSGDLLGNDNDIILPDEPTRADNSYHVVTGASGALLDGFTVTAGNANGTTADNGQGGGFYNIQSDPVIQNVIFSSNTATSTGGGVYDFESQPELKNVTFINNWGGVGGGMFNHTSSPILTNVQFVKNSSYMGGGMRNMYDSSPSLTKVVFSQNSAGIGGGMGNYQNSNPILTDVTFIENTSIEWAGLGGGMHNAQSAPILTNVTFDRNSAFYGGGMRNDDSNPVLKNVTFSGNSALSGGGEYDEASSPTIINSTFTGNSATDRGGGIFNTLVTSTRIDNTIFWGNTAPNGGPQIMSYMSTISNTVLEGGCSEQLTCTNIITTDPKLGVLGDYGGFTPTIPLLAGSSAIDAGNDLDCPSTDQRGVTRPQGAHCDIGAFEYSPATFIDVPISYWAWNFIERLYNAGITGGCSASPMMYCPEASVTRAQMAVFLLRGEHGSTYTPPAATGTVFGDVPLDYWAGPWIEQLAVEGITGGCGNGNYCPDLPVTRDQMAVFLLRAEHGSAYAPPAPTGVFTDVPTDYWAAAWIEQLAAEGITGGCGSGIYCPTTVVNRAQMAVFLVRTFNLP
ncbi:MAG: S-layer homology domain-containing protein [Chloroflexi bacterium]|nr:S-layer homology domain-containing protein [Chloroflexota bacterium]